MRRGRWLGASVVALIMSACGGDGNGTPADAGTPDTAAGAYFPCDVQLVMNAKCHTCHTDPPKRVTLGPPVAGEVVMAPFSLMEYTHTQRDYPGGGGLKIHQVMKVAIETDLMPLNGSPTGPLTATQKTTMLTWLTAGAPPAPQPCRN